MRAPAGGFGAVVIYLDTTKTDPARHRSGLVRVTRRLGEEWSGAVATGWERAASLAGPNDWFLTAEVFPEDERPGFGAWMARRRCRFAAIFHDAIPLRHPHTTWPRSVARHAAYVKMLARFDRVWAVSGASRDDLAGFWRWQGVSGPQVGVVALGADFDGARRSADGAPPAPTGGSVPPSLLCVGIIEPRKNQELLLDVAAELWREGLTFELHVVGRVNPHFGEPTERRIRRMAGEFGGLRRHGPASDAELAALYAGARASVFPTLAEGCGLPLLESLWRGVPCVCSDLPVLRENAGGGCLTVAPGDRRAWTSALRSVLTDDGLCSRLRAEARSRPLPSWAETAASLRAGLEG